LKNFTPLLCVDFTLHFTLHFTARGSC
jgi:hypothetical protein